MVRKAIAVHLLAYNLARAKLAPAVAACDKHPLRLNRNAFFDWRRY